ncbi:hypothetical protein IB254_07465 [Pseudomonas sp. PDM03]|uniref:hypothetical protein n=1 Tax=Pseudomonas sp. PDM03 TaxID=2769266 RepID=UPI00177BDDF6|nr:hypothetical protein [Pseudomonas sp. PDM03]MBD9586894.1 hypothetical protein [Pseudomonas sp. PDM03]
MNNKTTANSSNNNIKPAVPNEDLPLTEVVSETTVLKRRARSAGISSIADRQKPRGTGLDSLGGGNLLFEED